MRLALFSLIVLQSAAMAAGVGRLANFQLTDQEAKPRNYRFPKTKVSVVAVADRRGSAQLAPWIRGLHNRYQNRIDIDGLADVSMIAKPFQSFFREAFRRQLTYPVMLDWDGSVVKQFGYVQGVANIYVIDRHGLIVKQVNGSATSEGLRQLLSEVDRAIAN